MDVKKIAHGLKEHIDYWSYTLHRPAGQYGKGWDKDAELLGGLNVGEDQRGLLHIRVVKGKALPKPSDTKSFQQRVEIRVGRKLETGDAQQADSVDPGFNLAGYFEQDLYTNTQAEISVFNKSKYWDSLVGRVLVPVRELHDVRTFNGWLCLSTDDGGPAGFVYVACLFRRHCDIGFEELLKESQFEARENAVLKTQQHSSLIAKLMAALRVRSSGEQAGVEDVSTEETTVEGGVGAATAAQPERNVTSRSATASQQGPGVSSSGRRSSAEYELQPLATGAASRANTQSRGAGEAGLGSDVAASTGLLADGTAAVRTSSSQSRVASNLDLQR